MYMYSWHVDAKLRKLFIKGFNSMATVLESTKISPGPGGPPEFSLPMVFLDMLWYDFAAGQCVAFFEFPCSKSYFSDTIVPHLKKSLSLTLTHFLPVAGNIIHPLNPQEKPVLRYESMDSVSFTVSEYSGAEFSHLAGNFPRNCDEFYALAALLPAATHSTVSISVPVFALQVTLFPDQGLSLGFVFHHAVADASTVSNFIRALALINRIGPDEDNIEARLTEANLLPFFDRETVMNLNGLDSVYWDMIVKESWPVEPPTVKLPINKIRATFVLKRDEIEKLKDFVRAKCADVAHLSSFTMVCALVWACSAKSAAPGGEDVAEDEAEYFAFTVDCRGRLRPPLPANYFGNCVALAKTELRHGELMGADGFVKAAEAIGVAVKECAKSEKRVFDGAENWPEEYGKLAGKRVFGVSGSPRFDFYAADFGWGKPKKFETLFVDGNTSVSLCKSRDFEGGLEIGLSKTKIQMDAFARFFNQHLVDLN